MCQLKSAVITMVGLRSYIANTHYSNALPVKLKKKLGFYKSMNINSNNNTANIKNNNNINNLIYNYDFNKYINSNLHECYCYQKPLSSPTSVTFSQSIYDNRNNATNHIFAAILFNLCKSLLKSSELKMMILYMGISYVERQERFFFLSL